MINKINLTEILNDSENMLDKSFELSEKNYGIAEGNKKVYNLMDGYHEKHKEDEYSDFFTDYYKNMCEVIYRWFRLDDYKITKRGKLNG